MGKRTFDAVVEGILKGRPSYSECKYLSRLDNDPIVLEKVEHQFFEIYSTPD